MAKVDLTKMNETEENEYMSKIGLGKTELKGYELKVNEKLKKAGAEVTKWKTVIQQVDNQRESYLGSLNSAIGKMDALSQLLIDEENERRAKVIEDKDKTKEEK